MAETSITTDVASARPAERPLLRKFRILLLRLRAARRARRLAMTERIKRAGLSHID
jgi:hypothetical protein